MEIFKVETYFCDGFYIEKHFDTNGEFKKFVTEIEMMDPERGPHMVKAEIKADTIEKVFEKRIKHHNNFEEQMTKLLEEVKKRQNNKLVLPSEFPGGGKLITK